MDPDAGKIVAVESTGATGRTWTLDVCSNTWRMMRPPREPTPVSRVPLAYDADSHLIVAISDGVWTYSVEGNRWTHRPWSGGPAPSVSGQAIFEPSSGNVIARDRESGDLWSYSVGAGEWTRFGKKGPVTGAGWAALMTYEPVLRRLVMVFMPQPFFFWTFQPTSGLWSEQAAPPQELNFGWGPFGGEIAYDQSARRTVVFSGGVLATYDATQDRWANVPLPRSLFNPLTRTGPLSRSYHTMVYDPVNERIVILGGEVRTSQTTWSEADDVWAYKVASNTWTELVPSRR